ncbi:MAG: hypothetical protein IJN91_04090 [Alphaproteobacteria bacterium]|nr:hypothetical protein [Alphaproteobacteria bacterium]
MALKPRHKRRIIWTIISIIGALVLSIIIIPPMVTLNTFKPMIESAINTQMNVPAKLNGDIHFSLIGGTTIVAHDVNVPTATIGSVMLSIPFHDLFDMQNAQLKKAVSIYDANIDINNLSPASFNHDIKIYNSKINFRGHEFKIIRAEFKDNKFYGTVRTKNHKYEIEFQGDTFKIKNKNNNLEIIGQIYSDASIRGQIAIETSHINEWFDFSEPKIPYPVALTMNYEWGGGNSYKFTNIDSDYFSGNIEILENGDKNVQLASNDIDFDFSFFLKPQKITNKTNLNLDFYGAIKFNNRTFNHVKINANISQDSIQINNVIADDIAITGGTINANGAKNIMITMPYMNKNVMCLFSGTPEKWQCSKFTYGDLSGTISVNHDQYDIIVQSNAPVPSDHDLINLASKLGTGGTIEFKFSDIGGTLTISGTKITNTSYNFATNKTLQWLKIDLPMIPESMKTTTGNFGKKNGMLTFTPNDGTWQLSTYDNYFYLSGNNFKSWFPDLDLQSINDFNYVFSGFFNNDNISNLNIKIGDQDFFGSLSGTTLTLHTHKLLLDTLLNQEYFDNFSENEFLSNAPLLIPFELPINISLSSDKLVYKNNEYKNFIYALKQNSQTFSISDSDRGNLLATIERDRTTYDIFVQLNRFSINGSLLSARMPLNIRDTTITGQLIFNTSGQIAHDILYNMNGNIDITFNNGYIIGMSFDNFYASAPTITILNAEYALADALTSGETRLKTMRLIGEYNNGNFITTAPIELSMRHTDAIGGLAITDGFMTAEFNLTLRGTAPKPATIELSILPNGNRSYSLSEIMKNLDTSYMRAFIKTHDKF